MEKMINFYYNDNAKRLHEMVDKILFKLKFYDVDHEDFYSLANEIFVDVIKRYDKNRSFDNFLYSCLMNKFKTEMTKRNRQKRKADKMSISIETPIGKEDSGTIGNIIPDKETVESKLFDNREDIYSNRMNQYLKKLSNLQKEVLRLSSIGFTSSEIKDELHITDKQYNDCQMAIHSYRNISILF